MNIGFIGLGLIGGSIAKGLRKVHPDWHMVGLARSEQTVRAALEEKVIDEGCLQVDRRFSGCDMIFLCAPVEHNIGYLEQLKPVISTHCIITDVGSTKTETHLAAARLGMESQFIGGHPMAGSERSGFAFSTDHLLENAWYVLTPTEANTKEQTELCLSVIKDLNALPLVLDYEEHDYIVATISHLPHLIAAGLVNLVKDNDNQNQTMKQIAAGGFKDITRIASSSPDMWQQICLENPENISRTLDAFIRMLIQARCHVEQKDAPRLYDMFSGARDYRDSIDILPEGPLKKSHMLYCDIADEPGGIATIATLLAMEQISIKNLGIIHNREFEEGVLCIEFYEGADKEKALEILKKRNYTIHIR